MSEGWKTVADRGLKSRIENHLNFGVVGGVVI